jgi:SagB-type dehydrogenase family enzyme
MPEIILPKPQLPKISIESVLSKRESKRQFSKNPVKKHSIEKLVEFRKSDIPKITNINWLKTSGAIVVITAVFERNTVKYGSRGYRHILTEVGHLAQNLYLVGTSLNLNVCAIGGYLDDNLNQMLDVDGVNETVVSVLGIGSKA